MSLPQQLAKHLRDVYFGGNWTTVNLKDTLKDITWQQAGMKVESFNTIVALTYHISYYLEPQIRVLQGGMLDAKDEHSWLTPPVKSKEDWQQLLNKIWEDAEKLAALIEQLPDNKLQEPFTDEKYGTYYRNIAGMIEHTHYHLGQIILIKKILLK